MDGFEQEAARRAPLAEASYRLFGFVMDGEFLAAVFQNHRGRSYEAELTFATVVHLIGDALLEHSGSARRALRQARGNAELPVSSEAFYGKLRRIPQSLSQGFLAQTTRRLLPLLMPTRSPIPPSLQQFQALAVNGKKIKHAAKRLKPTRAFRGSVLGGKLLVALDLETGLAVAMNSNLDGEVNDPPLVPELLEEVRSAPGTSPAVRAGSTILRFEVAAVAHRRGRSFSDSLPPESHVHPRREPSRAVRDRCSGADLHGRTGLAGTRRSPPAPLRAADHAASRW